MSKENEQILMGCWHHMCILEITERPDEWRTLELEAYELKIKHGPEYRPTWWFGKIENYERVRLRRAITHLENGGLLITWRRFGRRLSHVRLTKKGEKIAKKLLSEVLP
jgi:hypothetical protein